MKHSRITLRYAKSLLSLAIEDQSLDECKKNMEQLLATCNSSRDLSLLLRSPIIKTDKKILILNQIFTHFNNLSKAFFVIIANKKRERLLEEIAEKFLTIYKKHKGIETAVVTTPTPLTPKTKSLIEGFVQKHTTGQIHLSEEINKSLIGGVIISLGDKQLDLSVLSRITELKQIFNKNPYIKDF